MITRTLHGILVGILMLPVFGTSMAQDDELLEPEKAFALQPPVVKDHQVELTWKIAPGYYLYQNKFEFSLDASQSRLGELQMPEAVRKMDDFFGEVDIYKKTVTVTLPIERDATDAEDATLNTTVQGCNEPVGVCYPPLRQTIKLALPAIAEASMAAAGADTQGSQRSALQALLEPTANDDDFLPPDEAFALTTRVISPQSVEVNIDIADGYYLYRGKFDFASASDGVRVLPYELPAGKVKEDEFLGRIEAIYGKFQLNLQLEGQPDQGPFRLQAKYQGCAEKGICYPPISKTLELDLGDANSSGVSEVTDAPAQSKQPAPAAAGASEEQGIVSMLAGQSLWATVAAFFAFGLALALTPCVFPMIPILSGIIVGQGADVPRRKAFMLSVAYVLGMAITYAVAGVLAGMTGELLSSAFQNPWVLASFSLVFVLLALSMFGFYDLQLPASWQGKLAETSHGIAGGAYSGVFVMGALSALIVGPCVAAPLSGALLYIGQTGDVVLGGVALFVMALGMGVPLLLIGASAGTLLPKAGAWMNAVKSVFGVLLLAVAIWLMSRIIPAPVTMMLWAALLIMSATYLYALDSLPQGHGGWHKLWKGTGILMLLYGVALFIGSLTGANDPLNPLEKFSMPAYSAGTTTTAGHGELAFKAVKGPEQLDQALEAARAAGKPVMIDFYADWCAECIRMENTTFKSPQVHQALENFQLLQIDVTANDEADKAVLKRFKLFGPPAILFFAPDGMEIVSQRVVGYQDAEQFSATVASVTGNFSSR